MLSNYSLGNKAQAGVKLFLGGRGGERDAALKRDIVNAVIGYHPTQAMERNVRSFWNTPREMQFRQAGDKVKLPTVMTDFRGRLCRHDACRRRRRFQIQPRRGL